MLVSISAVATTTSLMKCLVQKAQICIINDMLILFVQYLQRFIFQTMAPNLAPS